MPNRLNLDLDLVRAYVIVAEMRSFSRAGERLLRNQSTISLQIKRLEEALGRRLLDRNPKQVRLTAEGEWFLAEGRRLLAINDSVVGRLREGEVTGRVRLGTPEDFATRHLPDVLARFAASHPGIALEVACDLTLNLIERFQAGDFDLILVKREPRSGTAGTRVWREPLVWVAGPAGRPAPGATLPLVVSPEPCVYRKRAIGALERIRQPWRVAYTCASLAGSLAAVRAGLGVAVLPKDMATADLRVIDGGDLPDLADTEIALIAAEPLSAPAVRLQEHMVRSLERPGLLPG